LKSQTFLRLTPTLPLGETVEVDDDFVLSLVNDAEEHCGPAAVERLIDLAVARAKQLKSAGSEGTDATDHSCQDPDIETDEAPETGPLSFRKRYA
jgi:hypothetical protein